MIMVNKLSSSKFVELNDEELDGSKEYQSEVKHLVHWFKEYERELKQKYEFFYAH